MEVWKDINDSYEISNLGRVKSKRRTIIKKNGKTATLKEKILKPQTLAGYHAVFIYGENKKPQWKYIHRLVAEAFLPNPDNLPQVNHKNENKLNNVVVINDDGSIDFEKSNLEWCTLHYNMTYGTKISRGLNTAIKNGHYNDYSGMTISEKREKQKEIQKEKYLSTYKAEKRGRYEDLSNLTDEEKRKRRNEQSKKSYKKKYKPKKHKVYVYKLVPEFVSEFDSTALAAEYLDTGVHNVYANMRNKTESIKTNNGLFIVRKEKINEEPKVIMEYKMPIWDDKWFSDTIKELTNDPRIIPYKELENAKEITTQL